MGAGKNQRNALACLAKTVSSEDGQLRSSAGESLGNDTQEMEKIFKLNRDMTRLHLLGKDSTCFM